MLPCSAVLCASSNSAFRNLALFALIVGLAGCLQPQEATPVADRVASWEQHETMRRESQFSKLKWEAIGPTFCGGRIESIAVHPRRTATIYVGVGSGGLWKTVNNGLTWKPIFEQQSSIAIGDVAVSESDPDTIWVGTGEVLLARSGLPGMGVFRSDDAGKTWKNMGLRDTQHIGRVLIHPADKNTVYVAAIGHQNGRNKQRGVFRTTDGGESWQKVLYVNDRAAAIDLVLVPNEPKTLYASIWERVGSRGHTGSESGVYKSVDGGTNWSRLKGGLPVGDNVGRIGIHVAPSNPSVVYALADEGGKDGFYRSADGGQTWQKMYDKLQARWDWCELRVSPDDENEVYSIGQNSFVTKDGGKTFDKIQGTIIHLLPHGAKVIHLDTHAMWINPKNTDHVIFGTDGGLFVTHDRCQTWLHLNTMPLAECYAVTHDNAKPYNVYIGTQDNAALFGPHTHRPKDGWPDAWKHVYLDPWGGGDSYFTYRDPTDVNTIYYEHQLGAMRRKDMSSGRTKSIQPRLDGERLRFAWMTPFFPSKARWQNHLCRRESCVQIDEPRRQLETNQPKPGRPGRGSQHALPSHHDARRITFEAGRSVRRNRQRGPACLDQRRRVMAADQQRPAEANLHSRVPIASRREPSLRLADRRGCR